MKIYNVAILGTGFGGLGMALRLRSEGETDFLVLEKAGNVGGTWRDNTYPGAACDVRSHLYWFSFTERPEWSKSYCDQPEILHNIERLVERSGLKPFIRFNTEVLAMAGTDVSSSSPRSMRAPGRVIMVVPPPGSGCVTWIVSGISWPSGMLRSTCAVTGTAR